ncbi:MAG: DUF5103 domain-containing protein [Candidatus Kapaibacterium sp.]|nr:MAG: DUF5103 domain-containing protein [Candidatus Kapabacteria bacterium]
MNSSCPVKAASMLAFLAISLMTLTACAALRASASYTQDTPIVRGVRVYGGANESAPPIVLRSSNENTSPNDDRNASNGAMLGASYVTVELDVQANFMPAFVVRFVHCDALWREDSQNIIINTPLLRTTNVEVRQASFVSKYFTHRAVFTAPNNEVQLQFSGNWKAKIYEQNDPTTVLAEARFFVVEQVGACALGLISDTYRPAIGGTSMAAYTMEASIQAPSEYVDINFQTVQIFRNNRWHEPRIITQNNDLTRTEILYNKGAATTVLGFTTAQKRFRIAGIPAENEYRVVDISNPAFAPAGSSAIRLAPLADIRRNGGVNFVPANDGALITRNVTSGNDEYVFVEFILDPEQNPSSKELFLVGSFNNWRAQAAWKLEYDTATRLYRLKQWIRRGRHNYLYATGRTNPTTKAIDDISFEECEGNVLSANHTFYALYYYQNPNNGRYDALYGVSAVNASRRTR